jgi:hypothetical protein
MQATKEMVKIAMDLRMRKAAQVLNSFVTVEEETDKDLYELKSVDDFIAEMRGVLVELQKLNTAYKKF